MSLIEKPSSQNTENTLLVEQLSQVYSKNKVAIDNVDLTFKTGITGLLGANGAGKSSLMRILATINKPSSGRVFYNEHNTLKKPQKIRPILGYLPQYFGVYENLSAVEFLHYLASLKGINRKIAELRIKELLQALNLVEVANNPLKSYSGGMRQRVGIVQALLNEPKVLIIDEPTVGLDPEERNRFRELLVEYAQRSIVIFSTHIVSDIESIADQIAIMQSGKLLHTDSLSATLSLLEGKVWECEMSSEQYDIIKHKHVITKTTRKQNQVSFRFVSGRHSIEHSQTVKPHLEDAFLYFAKYKQKKEQKEMVRQA